MFGTANGISMYNGVNFTNYSTKTNTPKTVRNASNNDLWFNAGNNAEIYRFDGQNFNYLSLPIPKSNNSDNSYGITGISKDKNRNVWIATYDALFKFDGSIINL